MPAIVPDADPSGRPGYRYFVTITALDGPAPQPPVAPVRLPSAWTTTACWLLVGLGAGFALVRWAGFDGTVWPLMALPGLTPYLAIAALIPLAVCLLNRRWLAALASLGVLAALVALVAPRAIGNADPARGPAVRAMTANLAEGHADPAAIVALVRVHHVDVLALSELTGWELNALIEAGLPGLLPYAVTNPADYAAGTALFSRYPLTDGHAVPLTEGFVETAARVSVPGAQPVEVTAVHYCAPADPMQVRCWAYGKTHLPPATPTGPVRLLLGDFNLTVDYAALRAVLATGYRDAASVVGQGLVTTWPYDGKPVPPMAIDHVLADRRIGVSAVAVYPIRHSDHRAVFAVLTLPKS